MPSDPRLVKLLAVQKDLIEKLQAVTQELDDLLGGKAGTADLLKRLEAHFDQVWCVRYATGQHGRYVWAYAKDRPQMKRLIKTLGVEEIERRMIAYLKNDDSFYVKARHPFGLFVASINSTFARGPECHSRRPTLSRRYHV